MVRVTPALAWAAVAGTALGLGLWSLASLAPRLSRPRLARRVAPYLVDVSAGARDSLKPPPEGPLAVFWMLADPVVARSRTLLSGLLGGDASTARRLRQAGSSLTVEAFRSQQVLSGAAGAAAGLAIATSASLSGAPLMVQAAAVAVFAVTGIVARDLVLQRAARARLARLRAEVPVVLEFLALSLSAGEGLLDAVRRIARSSRGELAAELADVVTAVGTGLPFSQSLTALAADLGLPPFTRFAEQVVAALERGSPLAEVLRAQAQDARDDAKRDLLEVAGKKEVAMLVPLVFLILPVTIVFAIFPGIFVLQLGF